MNTLLVFILGLVIGANLGYFALALMIMASDEEDTAKRRR